MQKFKSTKTYPIYGILLFIFLFVLIILGIEKRSIIFVASQFLVAFCILIHWGEYFKCKYPSLSDAIVFCFTVLFFCVAPNLQLYLDGKILVNTSPFNDIFGAFVNILYAIFIFTYIFARKFYRIEAGKKILNNAKYEVERLDKLYFTLLLFFVLSVVAAFLAYKDIEIRALSINNNDESVSAKDFFINKVLYFFPYGFMALVIVFRKKFQTVRGLFWLLLVLAGICLLISKNPLLVKRNSLGPVYISLIYLWSQKIRYSKKLTLIVALSIIVIFFPLSSMLTNVKFDEWNFDVNNIYAVISSHFLELHYDAWANFHTVIEIVNGKDGLSYGKQLLGSILFFIPRSFWLEKPLATGNLIGDYLSHNYAMWFNNVSSPFVSEAYIDFGFIGVPVYAYLLARLTIFLDKLTFSVKSWERIAGVYFAVYVFFVLRGSLMIAVAYGAGSFIVFLVVYIMNGGKFKLKNIFLRRQNRRLLLNN